MFTGIIREIGIVENIRPKGVLNKLSLRAKELSKEARIGDSISVDGICLTVVNKSQDILDFDITKETFNATTLSFLKKRDLINLEPSLQLKEAVNGHLVSGHIDGIGKIKKIDRYGRGVARFTIGIDAKLQSFLVQKGSIAVSGISLTVNEIGRDFFRVDIIPHTLKVTTIGTKNTGCGVNIEFDIIGKYVLKNLNILKSNTINKSFLKANGFM